MKTDVNILKQFYSVLNRKLLTDEVYDGLLKIWEFDKLDLDEEQIKINQKKSCLSKSKRDAVPEFLILRKILEDQKANAQTEMTFDDTPNNNDQITVE